MTQKIIDAVCQKLAGEFGENYTIYTENVEQGLKKPCFFVLLVDGTDAKFHDIRYRSDYSFCVHYYPKEDVDYGATDRLLHCLETIEIVDVGKLRGLNRRIQQHDGIIQAFVDYVAFSDLETDKEPMQEATASAVLAEEV